MHPICHRTIYDNISNAEMERRFNTPEALRENQVIGRFVEWVSNKPADFDALTKGKH